MLSINKKVLLLVFFGLTLVLVSLLFCYREVVALNVLTALSIVPRDKPLKIVAAKSGGLVKLFAFSPRYSGLVVKLTVTGENIVVSPPSPITRGLSRDGNDPIAIIKSLDGGIYHYKTSYWQYLIPTRSRPDFDFVYELPFERGTAHKIEQGYNGRTHKLMPSTHFAIDFGMRESTLICAARGGDVMGYWGDCFLHGDYQDFANFANYILIRHDDGTYAIYIHLLQNGVLVRPGDRVSAGQPIGLSGNTGWSSGPHLHFCVFTVDEDGKKTSMPVRFRTGGGIYDNPQKGDIVSNPREIRTVPGFPRPIEGQINAQLQGQPRGQLPRQLMR